jgi:Coenzyme PQQ synthesis protein D (PqqD)
MITISAPVSKVRLLSGGAVAVISFWDESSRVSKTTDFTKPETGAPGLGETHADQLIVRSQSVVARVIAGETLIVPIRGNVGDLASIYSFNGTGTLIWKLLESPKSVVQLAASVAQEYEVEPAQAEHDVATFVSEMKAVGLVDVVVAVAIAGD